MTWKKTVTVLVVSLLLGALVYPRSGIVPTVRADSRTLTALHDSVQVDISCVLSACTSSTIATNQMRKLVVSSTGVAYAIFSNASGIWFTKSTDRGATFSAPTLVTSTATQGEIAISSDGTLYVGWLYFASYSGTFKMSKSSDGGTTWSGAVSVGSSRGSTIPFHLAVDGNNVFGLTQNGLELFVSTNAASSWGPKFPPYKAILSADVHVDPLTHDIYIFRAAPTVGWYSSSDVGTTWSTERETYADVDYLVSAFGMTGTDKFVYMAGAGTGLHRVNVTDESIQSVTVSASADNTTRSLAADSCGNVITGNKTGSDLYLQYSKNSGATFSSAAVVTTGADSSSVAINPVNGDVLYLYEKSGHIYMSTYAGLLDGPADSCYPSSATATNTPAATGTPASSATRVPATGTRTRTTAATKTPSLRPSKTPSKTPINTRSLTPIKTPIKTPSLTASFTATKTATMTPTPIPLLMKKGAVGGSFVLGLLQNGTLTTWGMNRESQTNIPPCCGSGISDIAVGTNFALALKGGKVYGWGANTKGQVTFPAAAGSNITAIAAGGSHGVALTNKGIVLGWGDNGYRQAAVPPGVKDVTQIAAGTNHTLIVKENGTVQAWGNNAAGQIRIPAGLKNVLQVVGGLDHSLALIQGGTIVGWGGNGYSQSSIPKTAIDIKQVSAGAQFSLAVKNNGTVIAWGRNDYNQTYIPPEYTNIYTVATGYANTILGLRSGRIIVLGDQSNGVDVSRTTTKTATPSP